MARYPEQHRNSTLRNKIKLGLSRLESCDICPRKCGVNRIDGDLGYCGIGRLARVASYNLHFGEEDPLVGRTGSGTIFFSGCNLGCVFCQNYDISHYPENGAETSADDLAEMMLSLQEQGACNINLVTPTHVTAQILEGLAAAAEKGLNLPLVYNCGGYESLETLELLDGVVDIYMPDIKFMAPEWSFRYCKARDYPERAKEGLKEMRRQVGDLVIGPEGTAVSGLLVRHLVMPDNIASTEEWMTFLSNEISSDTYLNIMDQYHPCGQASDYPEIARTISPEEYRRARKSAQEKGLTRLDSRESRLVYKLFQQMLKD